jgi:hypothetical protein
LADNTQLNTGTGGDTIRDKDRAGVKTQIVGLDLNPSGSEVLGTGDATNGLDVDVTRVQGTVTNDPTVVTAVDGAALPSKGLVIAGTDGSVTQVIVTDSVGRLVLPPTSQAGATVKTFDADTGAGTDTVAAQLIALPASGGAVAGGTATNPVRTDPTGTTTQPVSDGGGSLTVDGTVTANAGTGPFPVSDNAGSLTVDAPVATPVFVRLSDGAAAISALPITDNAGSLTVDGTVSITANSAVNVAQVAGTTTDTNSGVKSAGTQRVVLATDQPQLTNALKVDGSAVTQPVSGTVTADTEMPAAAALADATANPTTPSIGSLSMLFNGTTWDRVRGDTANGIDVDVTRLPALVAGSALVGRVNLDPQTANGLSIFHLMSAATTNATNIKASAGQVYGWYIYNSNAAARKVVFHNTAGTPTAGASVIFALMIPPTSAANVELTMGLAFATGIAITTVTDAADSGTTAVALNDLNINIFYK